MSIKDYLKIYIFPKVIFLLNLLGVGYEKLSHISYFSFAIPLDQSRFFKNLITDEVTEKQKIFVLTILTGSTYNLYAEALIALGLKKQGHEVVFIINDCVLPIHEQNKLGDENNWKYQDQKSYRFASLFLKKYKLKFVPISEFIKEEPLHYNSKFASILEASLMKHYKVGVLKNELLDMSNKTNLMKKAIAITEAIGLKIVSLNPDVVIMSHGIYSTWGVPFKVLDKKKVPILVHSRGKKMFTKVFNWNKSGDDWDVSSVWDEIKDKQLTKKQKNEVDKYLSSRIMHSDDVVVYNFANMSSKSETLRSIGLDPKKTIYTLFTNVLWDAASTHREIAFLNPIDWVIETIKWFNKNPERQLVVKIHPAEKIIGTNMPFYDIIVSQVEIKDNVKIIKPEKKINSWSIYEITDIGLVHTTTAGMELPLVNKPCVVVSKTHYREKGFTIDISSKDEYFDVLRNFDTSSYDIKNMHKLALRYAHLLFIRYQIPFNMFYEKKSTDVRGFRYTDIESYFKIKEYANIINSIVERERILNY